MSKKTGKAQNHAMGHRRQRRLEKHSDALRDKMMGQACRRGHGIGAAL